MLHFHYCLLPLANEVWGKVIFLHLFVISSRGDTWAGTPPRQVHAHPLGRYNPSGRYSPGAVHDGRYGQRAGDTHPTGMHSCFHVHLAMIDC